MKINMRKKLYPIVSCFLLFVLAASSLTVSASEVTETPTTTSTFEWPTGPDVYADAAIVMEASTGLILYQKDIYEAYYPASITKIMTTLLALENCNLNETVTMSHEAEWDVDFNSSRIGLVEGEQVSLEDALYAVMLESANEVSYAVGEHVAGGSIEDFAAMMNERAKELGAVNTNFVNPNGLHDDNHYTCAYDMALISQAAIKRADFRTITGSRTYTIPATNKNVARPLANHHRFIKQTIQYDGTIGGKTGGTTEAKTTLVTFAERDGLTLIAVVLHVDTGLHAYDDTANILDFAFENYTLYDVANTTLTSTSSFPDLFKSAPSFLESFDSSLRFGENSNIVLPVTANFSDAKRTIELYQLDELEHGDNVIGQATYTYEDKYVGSMDIIYYNEAYPLTQTVFNSLWPAYLLSPDSVFNQSEQENTSDSKEALSDEGNSEEPTSTPANSGSNVNSATSENKSESSTTGKLILILAIIGVIGLLIVLYIIFIELPHRKRRRAYYENHRRRMDIMRKSMKDDL